KTEIVGSNGRGAVNGCGASLRWTGQSPVPTRASPHEPGCSLLESRRCPNHPLLLAPAKLNSFSSMSTAFSPTAKSGSSPRLLEASNLELSQAWSNVPRSMGDSPAPGSEHQPDRSQGLPRPR